MKAIFRCPWCDKTAVVESFENWVPQEVLFTQCNNCDKNFVVQADSKLKLAIHRGLRLPKPSLATIKTAIAE